MRCAPLPRLAVVVLLGATAAAAEIQCIGGLAHRVTHVDEGSIAIEPAPMESGACLGLGVGMDRHICVGVNQDESCAAARRSVIPLPAGSRCQGCFVGAATDLYYTLNITGFHVQHIRVGFHRTHFKAAVRVEDDQGRASERKGSHWFGEKPLEWKIRFAGKTLLLLNLSMPTEIYYDLDGRDGAHGDLGVIFAVDMGDHYVEYVRGEGWSHRMDRAKVTVDPIHEGDYNALANFTVGVRSRLQAAVAEIAWFHLDVSPEAPVTFTSVGTSGADLVHSCMDADLKFDMRHEADVVEGSHHLHWGPTVDHHFDRSLVHKCIDVHPPAGRAFIV